MPGPIKEKTTSQLWEEVARDEYRDSSGAKIVVWALVAEAIVGIGIIVCGMSRWLEGANVLATVAIAFGVWLEIKFGGRALAGLHLLVQMSEQKTAEAIKAAESERLERILLEASVAPRRIRQDSITQIAEDLQRFAGQKVRVMSYFLDLEAAILGQQVIEIFSRAGIVARNGLGAKSPVEKTGVGIMLEGKNVDLLIAIQKSFELRCSLDFLYDPEVSTVTTLSQGVAVLPSDDFAATVLVGVKPIDTTAK